jgi:hypothetical protein
VLSQAFTDTPGITSLSFWVANIDNWFPGASTGNNSVTVYWDGSQVFSLTNTTSQAYTQYSVNVTATGSDSVKFALSDAPGALLLDDVSVPSVPSVPDGGTTLSLLGLAIIGLAGLRRKLSL